MARGGAASFAGAGLLALAASLAGGDFGAGGWIVVAVAVAAGLLAAVVLFASARLSRVGTHAVAALGALLIGVVVGVERPSYGLLYVWLAFFVATFFRPRAVALHVGWMLACAGVAMVLGDPLQRPLESWLLVAGTLGGTSAFVCIVRRHLLDLAARERESRAVLDTVLRTAPVGFALFDRELRYLRVSEVLASWSGRTPDEHVGRRVDELFPGLGEQVEPAMRHVLETGQAVLDLEATHGDRIFRSSRFPIRDRTGRITMIASLADDVTELTRAQEHLAAALQGERETRAFLDQLLEHAPLDFAFVDRDLVYRRINRRALESSGRPPEAILGRTVQQAYPDLVDQIEPALRSVLATGEPIVARHMRTDSA